MDTRPLTTRRLLAIAEVGWTVAAILHLGGMLEGRGPATALIAVGLALIPLRVATLVGAFRRGARAEALLARRTASMRDVAGAASWALDEHSRFSDVDEAFAAMFGRRPEQLVGQPAVVLLAPDDHQRRAAVEETLASHATFHGLIFRGRHADGGEVWVEVSGTPFVGPDGTFAGFDGAVRPLSDEGRRRVAEAATRSRVHTVLTARDIEISLQPIVDLTDMRVVSVEALSRFPGSTASPEQWFRDAAQVGLGVDLELLAVELALDRLGDLPDDVGLSLNVSPEAVVDQRLADRLLARRPMCPRITLELTEHTRIDDYEPIAHCLAPLRAAGVRLAIDDAGAGYASFRHVVRLEPDIIKLDRGIVAGIDQNPALRALAMSVILFALETKAVVAAEGIETTGELAALTALSVDQGQGYLLGRPSPAVIDLRGWVSALADLTRETT